MVRTICRERACPLPTNFIKHPASPPRLSFARYFEKFGEVDEAIQREKRLKKWNRAWKIELIEKENPGWTDLYPKLLE